METYKNLKKETKVLLAVSFALIAVGFLCVFGDLIHSLTTQRWFPLLHIVTDFLMLSVVLVYAVHGYKKPHGNSLKISFLLFGLYLVACSLIPNPPDEIIESRAYLDTVVDAGTGIATILVAYIGGRLDRIERNKALMIVTGAVLLASSIVAQFIFEGFLIQRTVGTCVRLFVWIALCAAYVARYEKHRAAGLADKADAETN